MIRAIDDRPDFTLDHDILTPGVRREPPLFLKTRRDFMSSITKANLNRFLSRPWDELAALKQRHWSEALEADPLATFHASEELWELLRESGYTTSPTERAADLDAHLRFRALLDRTRHVKVQAR